MEKWSLAGGIIKKKSKGEPICSISEIQSFCCIPKIANKKVCCHFGTARCVSFPASHLNVWTCPEMKGRKVWQWLKGIITSKLFLPNNGWSLSPAPYAAQRRLLSIQQDFTALHRVLPASQGRDCSFQIFFHQKDPSSCPAAAQFCLSCAANPWLPWWWNGIPQDTQAAQWPIQSPSWWLFWKISSFQGTGAGFVPPEQTLRGQKWMPSHEQNKSYLARERIKQTRVYNQ